jgi:hypothetical protein
VAVGVVFAAYLLLPSQIYGGSGADHRLPAAMFLLLIAASAPEFPDRRVATAIGVVTAVLLAARVAFIEYAWLQANRVYSADLTGIDMLPQGAKLAVAYSASAVNFSSMPELHLASLAVVRREAFVPTLFAYEGQQPVALRPPYAALADAATPQDLWSLALMNRGTPSAQGLRQVLQQYDFVVMVGGAPQNSPLNGCLRSFFKQPNFEILAVLHNPACGV